MRRALTRLMCAGLLCIGTTHAQAQPTDDRPPHGAGPRVDEDAVVARMRNGLLIVEAEDFFAQHRTQQRAWYRTTPRERTNVRPDGDFNHTRGASGGTYLEALPDGRRADDDPAVPGEPHFTDPGQTGVLSYRVHFNRRGRFYVWARVHSTNTHDASLYVGIDGEWPASGNHMQWNRRNEWVWCYNRRIERPSGVEYDRVSVDVHRPGEHVVMFSMREDGAEFDAWILTDDPEFTPADLREREAEADNARSAAPPVDAMSRQPARPPASREPNGDGSVAVTGELLPWRAVTLTMRGPYADERDTQTNPFTDYRMTVTFRHESGEPVLRVPGYFAADGDAGNTGAAAGTAWRAHLAPSKPGRWEYAIAFVRGRHAALDLAAGQPVPPYHGSAGSFTIAPETDPDAPRARGHLRTTDARYLRYANGDWFLKHGADAPETLLAYADFDGTTANKPVVPLHQYAPHLGDWRDGDPTWGTGDTAGRGRGLIGAINYLHDAGGNAFSFLTYNAGGDGDNVWPFVERDDTLHYDCSKLEQWGVVFEHAAGLGMYLHFKLQETEIDDHTPEVAPTALDAGNLGPERRLYLRELVARYAHLPALNWNLGEENTQTEQQLRDQITWLRTLDAYGHPIVLHTYPGQKHRYLPFLGEADGLDGLSLQSDDVRVTHRETLEWVERSEASGRPWVVAFDEPSNPQHGSPPDDGYRGYAGVDDRGDAVGYSADDVRRWVLWGQIMAGGAGVEHYFGYRLPENDLTCEDWRSRDGTWRGGALALAFFHDHLPFHRMRNADALVGNNAHHHNELLCFAAPGEVYAVYLPRSGPATLDLTGQAGAFSVRWYNPRTGGALQAGSVAVVDAGGAVALGDPPAVEHGAPDDTDWAALVRRVE